MSSNILEPYLPVYLLYKKPTTYSMYIYHMQPLLYIYIYLLPLPSLHFLLPSPKYPSIYSFYSS